MLTFGLVNARLAIGLSCFLAVSPPLLVSLDGQGRAAPSPPVASQGGTLREVSAEDIFNRFASRILLLTCDVSADKTVLASGVLVSDDGFIVTNAHVVEGCRRRISATYINRGSRRPYIATVRYYDKRTDTAVLKIDVHGLDHFELQSSARNQQVRVGTRVYSIGNPRGLEQSISEGIVSGKRDEDGVTWIQHSAPISPGSSGGALISSRGELLGINSYVLTDSQNLNFAVPIDTLAQAFSGARAAVWREEAEQGNADAVARMRKAADEGNAFAQLYLGFLYYEGRELPRDYTQALVWIRKSAEQGNAEAQATLGAAYWRGLRVQQDYAQAALWLRKAAEQGEARAQLDLGLLYSEGHGVPQDEREAAIWFRKAAEQRDAAAQVNLGALYLSGDGVPKDYSEAYFWVSLATAGQVNGNDPITGHEVTHERIKELLADIASNLTADALSQAESRARKWLVSHSANPQ